ncbi:MAG: amino acid transporter [Gemmataceae bacterium]|nr:amino acid transporter [Gemmataceae bacterium]
MQEHTAQTQSPTAHGHQSFWLWVMCLTGVDYFSTLGYQPSIAFEATGLLTPFATMILVGVTLFGAFPVYAYVAGKSPNGQGSIAMLERLVHGWTGKILVLVLLGFAATDFIITKTLSAADAAEHLIKNPLWPEALQGHKWQLIVTMVLLTFLGAMFLRGFREVIGLAVIIVGVYLVLNVIVVGSSLFYLNEHPEALARWQDNVARGEWHFKHQPFEVAADWAGIALVCLVLFPKLALGLSGFETGVAVMPLIKGAAQDTPEKPKGRIRNARKLLLTAALIMSVFLLGSSIVTSTLIAPEELQSKGKAANRALAYLAHGEKLSTGEMADHINPIFGEAFGTLYDLSTVIILWFAGASAMAGLLNLVPQYLPRYGMAPEWTKAFRPLVVMFTLVNLFVTWRFEANVEAQGAAYATGVLVLMTSACLATLIDRWRSHPGRFFLFRVSWPYALITVVFVYTTLANVIEKPDGIKIAIWFILAIVASSVISRFARSKELRFGGFLFADEQSKFLWDSMKHLEFPVLVPHRPGSRSLKEKEEAIRKEHRLGPEVPIVFIEASLGDASDFYQTPLMEVIEESGTFILRVTRCASIAHMIAALALELSKVGRPPEIHFGWSEESPMAANIGFLLFGEGNVPWMVRELILQAEPNPERQPRVIIG